MPSIRIPTPLRPFVNHHVEVEVKGETVSAAIHNLVNQYPQIGKHIFTETGNLRAYVNLFLNDEDIRHLQGLHTPLAETDRLMIIPSIAGG